MNIKQALLLVFFVTAILGGYSVGAHRQRQRTASEVKELRDVTRKVIDAYPTITNYVTVTNAPGWETNVIAFWNGAVVGREVTSDWAILAIDDRLSGRHQVHSPTEAEWRRWVMEYVRTNATKPTP